MQGQAYGAGALGHPQENRREEPNRLTQVLEL